MKGERLNTPKQSWWPWWWIELRAFSPIYKLWEFYTFTFNPSNFIFHPVELFFTLVSVGARGPLIHKLNFRGELFATKSLSTNPGWWMHVQCFPHNLEFTLNAHLQRTNTIQWKTINSCGCGAIQKIFKWRRMLWIGSFSVILVLKKSEDKFIHASLKHYVKCG